MIHPLRNFWLHEILNTLAKDSHFDLEEMTAVSEDVHCCLFHQIKKFGRTVLYGKYVQTPTNKKEIAQQMQEFEMTGLHGV